MLGQFIGVRGAITNDPQLKALIENPTDAKVVDQSKVNKSIAAQIVPPSLLKANMAQPVFTAVPTANQPKTGEGQGQASVDKEQPQN